LVMVSAGITVTSRYHPAGGAEEMVPFQIGKKYCASKKISENKKLSGFATRALRLAKFAPVATTPL